MQKALDSTKAYLTASLIVGNVKRSGKKILQPIIFVEDGFETYASLPCLRYDFCKNRPQKRLLWLY